MREIQQPFNELIEIILLKRYIHDLFYTTTIKLDMLYPSDTSIMGMLEALAAIKQIRVYIGEYHEDLTHNCSIKTVDNTKITPAYIINTEPGHFCSNYVIEKNLTDIPEENSNQIIQAIVTNIYQVGKGRI